MQTTNPLVMERTHRFGVVPFDQIKNEHYMDALQQFVMRAHHQIEEMKKSKDQANFKNTIVFLEDVSGPIETLSSVFNNIYGAESNDEIEKIAQEFGPFSTKVF